MDFALLPPPPEFTADDYDQAVASGSTLKMTVAWYSYISEVCRRVSSIDPHHEHLNEVAPVSVAVFVGLLNRCSRVMQPVLYLVESGRFGDSIRALNRSVCESAARLWWLVTQNDAEEVVRYLAWGLKSEIEMKDQILENIGQRRGRRQVIERRMLMSIDDTIQASGLTDGEVRAAKKVIDLGSIVKKLNLPRGLYTVTQKFGSHSVHGTWTDLYFHHLERSGDRFMPSCRDVPIDENDLRMTTIFVVDALRAFMFFLLGAREPDTFSEFRKFCDAVVEELVRLQLLTSGDDFELVETEPVADQP
jgi:hypothetical protein